MHEDLLGYLLGALSADEQRRVEDALAADPRLRSELERIRRSLEPLDSLSDPCDPPQGLADRTLSAIEHHEMSCRPRPLSVSRRFRGVDGAESRAASQPSFYSISDGIVLGLVGLAAITLLLPALANSRYEARKSLCANNILQIGSALIEDSLRQGGNFMIVPVSGNRAFDGVFASQLLDRDYISNDTRALLCPGTKWRQDLTPWSVPTLEQVDKATGPELDRLRQMAGGTYGYIVGYFDRHGQYRAIQNQSRPYFPILSDVPSLHLKGRQSANHGGRGQNIFYEDGHYAFVTQLRRFVGDDPWRNRDGYAEAGRGCDDAVLLPSAWPPVMTDADTLFISEPAR